MGLGAIAPLNITMMEPLLVNQTAPARVSPGLRAPLVVSALTVAITMALIPAAELTVSAKEAFLPAVLAVVVSCHLVAFCLLVGDYRDNGDRRILVTCWAYLAALVIIIGYAISLPGLVFAEPPLVSAPSATPYMYLFWHVLFPLLLGVAWAPWPISISAPTDRHLRLQRLALSLSIVGTLSISLVLATALFAADWPRLVDELGNSLWSSISAPLAVPVLVCALLISWDGVKNRIGPERWVPVAVVMCLCDLLLTYVESSAFTVGWYTSRTLSVMTAGVLVAAMLTSFRRMKATAEYLEAFDSLTGLPNYRNAHDALVRMVARSQRSGCPLSVMALSLDQFQDLHSRQGPAICDDVIFAASQRLKLTVRKGDTPARIDRNRFLVLLPDTEISNAEQAAERVRIALACLNVRTAGRRLSASVGIASLQSRDINAGELIERAMQTLRDAEKNGGNQVVSLTASPPVAVAASVQLTS